MNFEMRFGEESILMGVTSIFLSFPPFIPSFIPWLDDSQSPAPVSYSNRHAVAVNLL